MGISECNKPADGGNVEKPSDPRVWALFAGLGKGFPFNPRGAGESSWLCPILLGVGSVLPQPPSSCPDKRLN